jgi:hypothetical protein
MSPVEGDGNALIPARIRNGTERRAAEEDVLNIAKVISAATGEDVLSFPG